MKEEQTFFKTIVSDCLGNTDEDIKLAGHLRSKGYGESFAERIKSMDNGEFNLFLAKVVITASGKGVVGADLTEKIAFLKGLRL